MFLRAAPGLIALPVTIFRQNGWMRIPGPSEFEIGVVWICHVKTVDMIPQDLYKWTRRVYVHK